VRERWVAVWVAVVVEQSVPSRAAASRPGRRSENGPHGPRGRGLLFCAWGSIAFRAPVRRRDTAGAMSQENVEVVRRSWEAFQAGMERGDPGALFNSEGVADDMEWISDAELDGRTMWRGREGFVEFIRTWTEEFEGWSIRIERLIDAGDDRVVVLTHQSAMGKGSGAPVELNLGQVVDLRDGRQIRVTNYLSHAEALEAAGLRE
jgi:ketosteroid isomerase-like protein